MPPLITGEVAIVVSPLIALMADQKMILDGLGMTSCCYNSSLNQQKKQELEEGLIAGEYQILYITPESLVNCHDLIDKIYTKQGICMIAIDEAHCLSSYGFDFRPKYKEIVKLRKLLTNVPVLAVTATATDKVIIDIKTTGQIDNRWEKFGWGDEKFENPDSPEAQHLTITVILLKHLLIDLTSTLMLRCKHKILLKLS